MSYFLFLDDMRDPRNMQFGMDSSVTNYAEHIAPGMECVVVKNHKEFMDVINERGIPPVVSFDHDLGDFYIEDGETKERTGKICAEDLCFMCAYHGINVPRYHIHSGNPIGAKNIKAVFDSFKKQYPDLCY